MTRNVQKDDEFFKLLEKGVRDVLNDKDAKAADRLKAIEIGAKLLQVRYRIKGSEGGEDGSFFER